MRQLRVPSGKGDTTLGKVQRHTKTFPLISVERLESFHFVGSVNQQFKRLLMTKMAESHMFVKPNMPLEETFDFSS